MGPPACPPECLPACLPVRCRWTDGHPGWQFLPLTTAHLPTYPEGGQPSSLTSSFTFTVRPSAPTAAPGGLSSAALGGLTLPGGVPQGLAGTGGLAGLGPLAGTGGLGGLPTAGAGSLGGLGLAGAGAAGLAGLPVAGVGLPPGLLGGLANLSPTDGLRLQQGLPLQQQPLAATSPATLPALFGSAGGGPLQPLLFASAPAGLAAPVPMVSSSTMAAVSQQQQPATSTSQGGEGEVTMGGGGGLGLVDDDSLSPFEDPTFQQLMSVVAANANDQQQQQQQPGGHPQGSDGSRGNVNGASRGSPPGSGDSGGQIKRKAGAQAGGSPGPTERWGRAAPALPVAAGCPPPPGGQLPEQQAASACAHFPTLRAH